MTGKDKGKTGVIMRALPKENAVVIEGVGLYKRHKKGSSGKVGRIIERSRPIDASNVQLIAAVKVASAREVKKPKATVK